MRIIEVLADSGHADTLLGIAEQRAVVTHWMTCNEEEKRCSVRFVVAPETQQSVIDSIQQVLTADPNWRLMVIPVEATLPKLEETSSKKKSSSGRSREELYQDVESGARITTHFIWLVIFSTIVATIGLLEDNVAVVIGAMVIAPLLGPNIGFAFGAALGDRVLINRSLLTAATGLSLALVLAFIIGLFWPANMQSSELLARTDVGLAGIVLALVSGAAGVLSLTSGLSSTLVGVMVAVAILPPTATVGLMLASGQYRHALGAALLLAVNIVSVNLAAKVVLLIRGVRPRTWLEKQKAQQSIVIYIVFWVMSLLILIGSMQLYHVYLQGHG
jgi:uncharacterized hydrophobic protein (TIGR00341 family)